MYNKYILILALIGCLLCNMCFAFEREIAITIDDLPFVGNTNNNIAMLQREQNGFLSIMQVLIDNNVPATGFVIAGAIARGQWELLEQFLQAGFIIGNHTYSHINLSTVNTEKYIANVDKADRILMPLMPGPKYFRYPYLAEGRGEKRRKVQQYLAENNYIIAPVTIDSKDFLFNKKLYSVPRRLRAQKLEQIKQKYLDYIWKQTLIAENSSKKYKNQPVKQILLIHANLLNSYVMGDIIELYRQNGYRFISLTEALEPPIPEINVSKTRSKRLNVSKSSASKTPSTTVHASADIQNDQFKMDADEKDEIRQLIFN